MSGGINCTIVFLPVRSQRVHLNCEAPLIENEQELCSSLLCVCLYP